MTTRPPRWAGAFALVLSIIAWPSLAPRAAVAQEKQLPAAVVAVVDYEKLIRDAMAAQSIAEQMQDRQQRIRDDVAREERRLAQRDDELDEQKSVMSPEAYQERRRAFQADVADVQRRLQERMRRLEDLRAAALREVEGMALDVVTELAGDYGFNIVLPSTRVLLFTPNLNLTDQVLASLDARLPTVAVPDEAP